MTRAADYPLQQVRIACRKCGREGVYRREMFIELVGEETTLPDALARMPKNACEIIASYVFTIDKRST